MDFKSDILPNMRFEVYTNANGKGAISSVLALDRVAAADRLFQIRPRISRMTRMIRTRPNPPLG